MRVKSHTRTCHNKNMLWSVLISLICLFSWSDASHFRGGTISWKPSGRGNEILVDYRVSWRRSFNWRNTGCDDATIQNRHEFGGEGDLLYHENNPDRRYSLTKATYICTDYSVKEDWTTGEKTSIRVNASSPDRTKFWVGFYGRNWIGSLVIGGGGNWDVWSWVNLTRRHDNGKINSSPVTRTSPIIRVQHGCYHEINILATDVDNDVIICKWADRNVEGCGGICNGLPYAELNPRTCVISYNATRQVGWFGVAIQIFDYANIIDPEPLSSIPLQFLLSVYEGTGECTKQSIRFSQLTRKDQSCIGVRLNVMHIERFYATTDSEEEIVEFITSSPSGMVKSKVQRVSKEENRFLEPLTNGSSWYYVQVSWNPKQSQLGSNIFCFSAVSKSNKATKQRCITYHVGVDPPSIISSKPSPNSVIIPTENSFEITYDQKVLRPYDMSFFKIYDENFQEIFTLNAATSFDYQLVGDDKITVQIRDVTFVEKKRYFVTLDDGFVTGVKKCGAQSEYIRDQARWNFTIKDVTEPKLNFQNAPSKTNSLVNITWQYDEKATTKCALTTPSAYLNDVNCSATQFTGNFTNNGFYTLWIYGMDESGNTGLTGQHNWLVDTTPPTVLIDISKSPNVSNHRRYEVFFRCSNNEPCFAKCRLLHQKQVLQTFTDCSLRSYSVQNASLLQSGSRYSIEIIANDDVDNVAPPMIWSWLADFDSPTLQGLSNHSIVCGKPITPLQLGTPTVQDSLDPNPSLSYTDQDVPGCTTLRIWTTIDHAGNKAILKQFIKLTSLLPIRVNLLAKDLMACSDELYAKPDVSTFTKEGLLVHPCNKSIDGIFTYSPSTLRCNGLVTRKWVFTDSCGQSTNFDQLIKILPIQDPSKPKKGEVNVDLWYELEWPPYPNCNKYRLFIWPLGSVRGEAIETTYISYSPSRNNWYPSNTKMLWQIEYVLNDGITINDRSIVPSPVWGFTTRPISNLEVIKVTAPPEAFTGRTIRITWQVTNVGSGQNFRSYYWNDKVFLTKSKETTSGLLTRYQRQHRILFPNDAYTSSVDIYIPKDLIGEFYVVVVADIFENLIDEDRQNNRLSTVNMIKIRLTPPPDLIVSNVVMPSQIFSGSIIAARWKVRNNGNGPTVSSTWTDLVYLNSSSSDYTYLARHGNTGQLFPGNEYQVIMNITIPKYIAGKYNIFIRTNAYKEEFEFQSYDNNIGQSVMFDIFLTPPPDLRLKKIISTKFVSSRGSLNITYTVINQGSGSTDNPRWTDIMEISKDGQIKERRYLTHFGHLERRDEYSGNFRFVIPSFWESGEYSISITTNFQQDLFENEEYVNNQLSEIFTVQQIIPDLKVESSLNFSLPVQNQFDSDGNVFITVDDMVILNAGEIGVSSEVVWRDAITIKCDSGYREMVRGIRFKQKLDVGQSYTFPGFNATIKRQKPTKCLFEYRANFDENILERGLGNNVIQSDEFTLPTAFDNVQIRLGSILLTDSEPVETIFSGSTYVMDVVYEAITYPASQPFHDTLELQLNDQKYRLGSLEIILDSAGISATKRYLVNLPKDIFGNGVLILRHDIKGVLIKESKANIILKKEISIDFPPTPDLVPTNLAFERVSDGIMSVQWSVQNQGNSMETEASWIDAVYMVRVNSTDSYLLFKSPIAAKLESGQIYQKKKEVSLPTNLIGEFNIKVTVDSGNDIKETEGEENNDFISSSISTGSEGERSTLVMKKESLPDLLIELLPSSTLGEHLVAGDEFNLDIKFTNNGSLLAKSPLFYTIELQAISQDFNFLMYSTVKYASLETGSSLFELLKLRIPVTTPIGNHTIAITLDKNRKIRENRKDNNILTTHEFVVKEIPSSRIEIISNVQNISIVAGEPIKISFQFINQGPGMLNYFTPSFVTMILSEDQIVDPIDLRLCGKPVIQNLNVHQAHQHTMECSLPFDLPLTKYYLILTVNGRTISMVENTNNSNIIEMDNLAQKLRTDIAVINVKTRDHALNIGGSLSANWQIVNNGSEVVEKAYKCDTLYLSEDMKWDLDDREVDKQCGMMNRVQAGAVLDFNANLINIPMLKQAPYYSIVKTRSSIRELNTKNNNANSNQTVLILHQNLTLGIENNINIGASGVVLRIPNVPPGESLSIMAESDETSQFIDLFINSGDIATSNNFIAHSGAQTSSKQSVTISNTKKLDYYIFIRSLLPTKTNFNVKLLAKIAVFEIMSVFPMRFPALQGQKVTFEIKGSLFPAECHAHLLSKKGTQQIDSINVYRLSSTRLFATFVLPPSLMFNNEFIMVIIDVNDEQIYSEYIDQSLIVDEGQPGVVKIHVSHPAAVRPDENIEVEIIVQNEGNTDVLPPLLYLNITGDVKVRNIREDVISDSGDVLFLGSSFDQPAGILSPKSATKISLEVIPNERGSASYPIYIQRLDNIDLGNPYLKLKDKFKPLHMSNRRWEPVWNQLIKNLGSTMKSFHQRLCQTASHFTMIQDQTIFIDKLIDYELAFADGLYLSNNIQTEIDLKTESVSFLPITIKRYINPLLSFRDIPGKYNGYGPFGKAWLAPYFWSVHIISESSEKIALAFQYEFYEFIYVEEENTYMNVIGTMNRTEDGLIFEKTDQAPPYIYHFHKSSNELVKVQSSDNSSIIHINEAKTAISDIFGNRFSIHYGDNQLVDRIQQFENDVLIHTVDYVYDEANFLTKVVLDLNKEQHYYYSSRDFTLVRTVKQDTNHWIEHEYNSNGHLIASRTNVFGHHSQSYEQEGVGHLIIKETPGDKKTEVKFNSGGKVVWSRSQGSFPKLEVFKNDGRTIYMDDMLLLDEVTNDDLVQTSINAEGAISSVQYSENGRSLVKLTDGNGVTYHNTFLEDSNLNVTTYPDGLTEEYKYNEKGNLISIQSRDEEITNYLYDQDQRLNQKKSKETSTTYEYFNTGLLKKVKTKDSTVEISYDENKRPVRVTYDGKTNLFYKYNDIGQRVSLTDSSGLYNITYHYDVNGRFVSAKQNGHHRLLKVNHGNGVIDSFETGDKTVTSLKFLNRTGALEKMSIKRKTGEEQVFEYQYDRLGRKKKIEETYGNTKRVWKLAYDRISQLIGFDNGGNIENEITYDDNWNRKSMKTKQKTFEYQTNDMNQLLSVNTDEQITYDLNGNLIRVENLAEQMDQKFEYNDGQKLKSFSEKSQTCSYVYDALDHLKQEICAGVVTDFLIDPFGMFGADIIGEFTGGNSTYFFHGMEHGLISQLQVHNNNAMFYYQFDHIGSVIGMTDVQGQIVNTYTYDPFGNILIKNEQFQNPYQFIGQWGVKTLPHLLGVYSMRNRIYFARYGRFGALDPIGFGGGYMNLYCYVGNNPTKVIDPQGTIPLILVSAAWNVGIYLVDQGIKHYNGEGDSGTKFWAGLAGATVSGLIPIPGTGDAYGNIVKQSINIMFGDQEVFDLKDYAKDVITGLIPFGLGKAKHITKGVRGKVWAERLKNLRGKSWQIIGGNIKKIPKAGKWLAEQAKKRIKNLFEGIEKYVDGKIKDQIWNFISCKNGTSATVCDAPKLFDDFLEWVLSIDPNDIIGPAGYGDGHFIPLNTDLKYKVRFENDINATAPAQKVLIMSQLDDDLDLTTFEFCSFGFGNYTFVEKRCSPVVQKMLNVKESMSIYVRLFAALDLKERKITVVMETLEPTTGERPSSPLVGFLPPNPLNGTDGQGFFTYTVRAKEDTSTYSVINAKASIIFDQNEAIETPPIFNTIDGDEPFVNISLVNTTRNYSSSVIIKVNSQDEGSGLSHYDVFKINETDGTREPLLHNMNSNLFTLDFASGTDNVISVSSYDNVGNQMVDGPRLNLRIPKASCKLLNDCSNNGACVSDNVCSCFNSRYGKDCNSTEKPLEPPIIFVNPIQIFNFTGKLPVLVYVKRAPGDNKTQITAELTNIPDSVKISTGQRVNNTVFLSEQELSEMEISFDGEQQDFKLKLTVHVEKKSVRKRRSLDENVRKSRSFEFTVSTKGSLQPDLTMEDNCYPKDASKLQFMYNIRMPLNSLGTVKLILSNVPKHHNIQNGNLVSNGTYQIDNASNFDLFTMTGAFSEPFNILVTASAAPTYGDVEKVIRITQCQNNEEGKESDDDSFPLIIGLLVAGVVLVILIGAIVICCKRKRGPIISKSSGIKMNEFI
ncbi:uncharacterized protein [Clytia hemisphaerica]